MPARVICSYHGELSGQRRDEDPRCCRPWQFAAFVHSTGTWSSELGHSDTSWSAGTDCGKTSVLEAIELLVSGSRVQPFATTLPDDVVPYHGARRCSPEYASDPTDAGDACVRFGHGFDVGTRFELSYGRLSKYTLSVRVNAHSMKSAKTRSTGTGEESSLLLRGD